MRLSLLWIILAKELREIVRDSRTLVHVILLPTILYPLLIVGMSKLQRGQLDAQKERTTHVAVWGQLPEDVRARLATEPNLALEDAKELPPEVTALVAEREPRIGRGLGESANDRTRRSELTPSSEDDPLLPHVRRALSSKEIDAVLVSPSKELERYRAGSSLGVVVYVDSARESSRFASSRLEGAFERVRTKLVESREREAKLPEDWSRPTALALRDTASGAKRAGYLLGMLLPLILFSMSLLGVFLPAVDLTAGEKERGTLETLLCAPVTPTEIMAAKFLTVWTVSLVTSAANVAAFGVTLSRVLPIDVPVPVSVYGLTFALLVPVTALFSSLFLAVAAFAKDFKEGQNILLPVYLPCALLASAAVIPGVELDRVTVLVPVVNIALLIKAVFLQQVSLELAFLAAAATTVYAALGVGLAARVFASEEVLLGGKTGALELLRGHATPSKRTTPTPMTSLFVFSAMLSIAFHAGPKLLVLSPPLRLLVLQIAFVFAPAVVVALVQRLDLAATFALSRPRPMALVGALLLGAGAWTVAVPIAALVKVPKEVVDALARELDLGGAPLPVLVIALGVLPALSEEAVFRGFVFAGLRRLGAWPAIVGSALLFGVAHASVYRMLPTVLLGTMLGVCRERTKSLWPGMLVHATNNALLVTLARLRPELAEATSLPWAVMALGTLSTALGLWVISRATPRDDVS